MKPRRKKHSLVTVATLVAAALAVTAGIAYATIPSGGVIHGCYSKSGGALRVIDASVRNCKLGETALDWNVLGAQGPQGPQGPEGLQGPVGPQGPAGVSGRVFARIIDTVPSGDGFEHFVAPCPAGKVVLGGGYAIQEEGVNELTFSGPGDALINPVQGWAVSIGRDEDVPITIQVYAICANA
jgi:hypothetical protein